MNWKLYRTVPILSVLLLSACGVNNDADESALSNRRGTTEIERVQYYPGDDTGDFSSNANNNYNNRYDYAGIHDRDTDRLERAENGLNHRRMTNMVADNNRNRTNADSSRKRENDDSRIAVADRAADKIVALREVDQANVFVTENNAYVAAQLENNIKNTAEIEKRISEIVKSTDRDIDRVYVSLNPDFYNRTASYANDIRNGRPVAGFAEEFTNLIERVFPTVR